MTDPRLPADDPALQPLVVNTEPLKGKKVLITGIANQMSIAYGAARACRAFGADIAMTYLNDKTREFTEQLAEVLQVDPELYLPHDITNDAQTEALFAAIQKKWGKLDVMLHAMAFAPKSALHAPVLDCSLQDFQTTMAVSAHSLIVLARHSAPLMIDGGSIFTLTYFGGDRVIPNYGIMGPAKSCLEGIVRYLAAELGPKNISVNAISPGPLLTRAGSGIAHFDDLMNLAREKAPEHVLVTPDEVGVAMAVLASERMRKVTGGTHFIDGGFNIMGG
jgi:enoyl-[acyl-carrier protein] reductase I